MGAPHIVGLDIGTTAVRAVELRFGPDGPLGSSTPSMVRLAEEPLPPGAVREGEVVESSVVTAALRELWSRGRFSTKNVAIGVGNQRVMVRDIEMPWLAPADRRGALPFHVAEALPMSLDDAILDLMVTSEDDTPGPDGRMMQGMLVAAQKHTVEANVNAVDAAGLVPVLVDLNGFALIRALARGDHSEQVVALIDMGASSTTVVVAEAGVPRLVRNLALGGNTISATVASTLQIPFAEAEKLKREHGLSGSDTSVTEAVQGPVRQLVEAIRNTLVYYASSHPGRGATTALVVGGGLALQGFGQYLASATRVAVSIGDPIGRLKDETRANSSSVHSRPASLALAVGLAYGVAA